MTNLRLLTDRATASLVLCLVLFAAPATLLAQGLEWEHLCAEVVALHEKGQYAQAAILATRAVVVAEQALGPNDPSVATSLSNLAMVRLALKQYPQAEVALKRALTVREKNAGPDGADVANGLDDLAQVYLVQSKYDLAEPLLRKSLAIREKAFGPSHPLVATSLEKLATVLEKTKREAEAKPLRERAIDIRKPKRPATAAGASR